MKSIIRLLGTTVVATLVFSAIATLGAGSALALLFLTSSTKELFTMLGLTSLAKTAVIETKTMRLECGVMLGHGLILNQTDIAQEISLTLHECDAPTFSCFSAGEPKGLIKMSGLEGLLVSLLDGKYGLKLSAEKGNFAEYSCGGLPVVIKGSLIGEFTEGRVQAEEVKAGAKLEFGAGTNGGEPKIKDYGTLNGLITPARLELSLGIEFEEANIKMLMDMEPLHPFKFCHK
jgi:hypothetical protein